MRSGAVALSPTVIAAAALEDRPRKSRREGISCVMVLLPFDTCGPVLLHNPNATAVYRGS